MKVTVGEYGADNVSQLIFAVKNDHCVLILVSFEMMDDD